MASIALRAAKKEGAARCISTSILSIALDVLEGRLKV